MKRHALRTNLGIKFLNNPNITAWILRFYLLDYSLNPWIEYVSRIYFKPLYCLLQERIAPLFIGVHIRSGERFQKCNYRIHFLSI